jgi:hypothetical protein
MLSAEDVIRSQLVAAARRCYERALQADPNFSIKVTATTAVDAAGCTHATFTGTPDTPAVRAAVACINAVAPKMCPTDATPRSTITTPFTFTLGPP